jgi:hypothetical protein
MALPVQRANVFFGRFPAENLSKNFTLAPAEFATARRPS